MATQSDFFYGPVTVVSAATAVSIADLLSAASFTPTGACVALRVAFGADTYWGNASTITDATGALLTSGTVLTDSATGAGGNAIPIAHIFIYKKASGDATGTLYARFTP